MKYFLLALGLIAGLQSRVFKTRQTQSLHSYLEKSLRNVVKICLQSIEGFDYAFIDLQLFDSRFSIVAEVHPRAQCSYEIPEGSLSFDPRFCRFVRCQVAVEGYRSHFYLGENYA